MGGGGKSKTKTKVIYQPAPVQKDNSFGEYLKFMQQREDAAQRRADQERAEQRAREDARRERGMAGLTSMRSGLESQLQAGLIDYGEASQTLRDYGARYDLGGAAEAPAQELADLYTKTILPGRRSTGTLAAYEEILGREATDAEKAKATERFQQGYYKSVKDLKDSLYKSKEYTDKYNQSYLDNYYDTMYGKQTRTDDGKLTGKRTFAFSKDLMPSYDGDLKGKTGINMPDYEKYFGEARTVAELDEQRQGLRQSRQFLYQAGLTNLQGDIDKNIQSIKTEGDKSIAKIRNKGSLMSGLTQGFFQSV